MEAASATEEKTLEKEVDDVLFAVQLSTRYHARRQAFFGRWRTTTAACSAVLGALAGGNALAKGEDHRLIAWTTLAVAVIGALDMVVGTAKAENKHRLLRSRFLELQGKIDGKDSPTRSDLTKWKALRLRIEQDEAPLFHIVWYQARNELCRARGIKSEQRFPIFQRWTAQLFRWPEAKPRAHRTTLEILWFRTKFIMRALLLKRRFKHQK
jgi:hypothetical protein